MDRSILASGQYEGHMLRKRSVDNCIISTTSYSATNDKPEWHSHENLHIACVFQEARSETKQHVYFTKKEGSVLFYHSDELHRYTTKTNFSRSTNIEIPANFLKKYNIKEAAIKKNLATKFDAKSIILSLQAEMLSGTLAPEISMLTSLLELVSGTEETKATEAKWILHLRELLQDNWNDLLTLDELSTILQVHPVTISKNFRKYFACTLGEYRRKIKIERSIALIKGSSKSLTEIAHFCGFADQSHFIRNFKEYTGFLPKDFKKF